MVPYDKVFGKADDSSLQTEDIKKEEVMKEEAKKAFKNYTGNYDTGDIKIRLKIDHTYRVAEIAGIIASSVGADKDFSWILGLLHDIGRFEQLKRFDTFIDKDSIDHARLGADILFKDGLIEKFPTGFFTGENDFFPDKEKDLMAMAETAVRVHNKLALPKDLDETTDLYCRILRTADKVDIMRVLTEPPYDERNEAIVKGSKDGSMLPARDEVMRCVSEHRCVPKTFERTDFESLISQCCMCFELDFPIGWEIVKSQGYLMSMMSLPVEDKQMADQLAILRHEMNKAWEREARNSSGITFDGADHI